MSSDRPKTPAPPKTRSGEMHAVKVFREAIAVFDDETVPKLDVEVDRMGDLLKSVTPATDESKDTPIPAPPRTPSFVDEEERAAKEGLDPNE